jgi:primosomal protein N''
VGADRDPVTEAIDGLLAFVDDLDHQLARLIEATDKTDADPVTPLLQRIRTQRQRLAQIEALAERHVAQALGTGQHAPAGIAVKVHGGWDRKDWQHRDIARLLAENALVDEATGEVDAEQMRVAMRAVYRVIEAGRMDWRVTDLKAAGLTLDGLCKEERKRMTVQFLTPAETR